MDVNELARRVVELTSDVEAQRKALERVTDERDQWRNKYHDLRSDLRSRLYRLGELQREISEVANG